MIASGPAAGRRIGPRSATVGAAAVAGVVVWLLLLRPVTPLDFRVFYSAGVAIRHSLDPYPTPDTSAVWSGAAFVYPYAAAWLFAGFAGLSVHVASFLWAVLSVAAITAGVWLVVGARWQVLLAVLLASPTLDGLQMGTVNAVLFLGLAVAWRWRDRAAIVGLAVALLIALKLFLWPLGLWLLLSRRWPAGGVAAAIGTAIAVAGFLAGPLSPAAYLRMLNQLGAHEAAQGSGLQGLLIAWGTSPAVAEVAGVLVALAGMLMVSRRVGWDSPALFVAAVAAALIASPVVWHHYYLLAAAPLLLIARTWRVAAWYPLVGWASVAPHPSAGVSFLAVTVAADGVLALLVLRLLVRHRPQAERFDRRLAAVGGGLAVLLLAIPLRAVGGHAFVAGLTQAALPVAALVCLCVAAGAAGGIAAADPCVPPGLRGRSEALEPEVWGCMHGSSNGTA